MRTQKGCDSGQHDNCSGFYHEGANKMMFCQCDCHKVVPQLNRGDDE